VRGNVLPAKPSAGKRFRCATTPAASCRSFIEWSKDAVHPSVDARAGCRIDRFELATPRADDLRALAARLRLDVAVANAPQASLRAAVTGPKGKLSLPA
jgi:hypothetical protein